jgi:tetratricopeptide (TPR) repeat protein
MIKHAAIALAMLLAAGAVRAEDCPTDVPDDSGERRQLAKKWFSKGESAAHAGDDLAALKAYQCSNSFVPHGFTAYNIGQLAEKIGDLDLAIASYGQYLKMMPDAQDAEAVGARLDLLKERLAKVREGDKDTGPALDRLLAKSKEESFPESPVPEPAASPEPTTVEDVSAKKDVGMSYRTMGYITAGSGAALVLGGVLSNVLARGQMDTCDTEYKNGNQSAADSACSNAKPLAYLSYGLIAVGGAAVAAGVVLMFLPPREAADVAFDVLPEGGLSLRYAGRF